MMAQNIKIDNCKTFIRQSSDGGWQICQVFDKGKAVSIQDVTWQYAEQWIKNILAKPAVIDALAGLLGEEEGYPADDEQQIAKNSIDTIIREAV